jgi:hypothetical protein
MKDAPNWRPRKSEIRKAIIKYRESREAWVKCRLRILETLLANLDATNSELADHAGTNLKTVDGLFYRWRLEGMSAVVRFGRPPELMEKDRKELERLILAGELESPKAVQDWVEKRPRLPKKNAFTLDQACAIFNRAPRVKRVHPQYRVPADFLANLKLAKPKVAAALEQVLAGASLREAAGAGCESLLRYYLKQAAKPNRRRSPPGFGKAFLAWCDQQSETDITFENVKEFLKSQKCKADSTRTIHRYLQRAKKHKGIPCREWTSGGSKHSGLTGL